MLSTASCYATIINDNYYTIIALQTRATSTHRRPRITPQKGPTTTTMSSDTSSEHSNKRRRLPPSSEPPSSTSTNTLTTLPATTTTRAEVYAIWNTPLVDSLGRRVIAQPTNHRPYLPTLQSPYTKPAPPYPSIVDGLEITQYNLALRRFEHHDYAWRKRKFRELGRLLLGRLHLVWAEFARGMLIAEREERRRRRRREILATEWLGERPRN